MQENRLNGSVMLSDSQPCPGMNLMSLLGIAILIVVVMYSVLHVSIALDDASIGTAWPKDLQLGLRVVVSDDYDNASCLRCEVLCTVPDAVQCASQVTVYLDMWGGTESLD